MLIKLSLKLFASAVVAGLLATDLQGDQLNRGLFFIETETVDGFSIGVTDENGSTNTSLDRRLCFTVWETNKVMTANNHAIVAFPTQSQYAYQVDLFDIHSNAMPRTKLGGNVGSNFLDCDSSPHQMNIKFQRMIPNRKGELSTLFMLFRPSDLFLVDKPGNYTLRIRFQILAFPKTGPNPEDYTNVLIRFPTLNYPLVKPNTTTVPEK